MANLFFMPPIPPGNGAGAGVDTSAAGKEKTIQVEGAFAGTTNIEISLDNQVSWVTVLSFTNPGKRIISVAAQFMRVRREGVPGIAPGAPTVLISTNNDGGLYAVIPAAPASVDISALGSFKTVTVVGNLFTPVNIEISDNGVEWSTCFTFVGPDFQSKSFTSRFVRASKNVVASVGGINEGAESTSFGPPVTVVGANNAEGVSGDAARADHEHRLEVEVADEGALEGARPRLNFIGDGVTAADNPGGDRVDITIPGGTVDFAAPVTVVGANNVEGVSPDAARADHEHRLEVIVADDLVAAGSRPILNFIGSGVVAADNPGGDRVDITIPGANAFAEIVLEVDQVANLNVGDHVEFDLIGSVGSPGVSLATGAGQANGLITLQEGVYWIEVFMASEINESRVVMEFRDNSDDSQLLDFFGGASPWLQLLDNIATDIPAATWTKWRYVADAEKTIKLAIEAINGGSITRFIQASRFIVEKIS